MFWPLSKITTFKAQKSLLRAIILYIYYFTAEYIKISSNLCFRTTILYNLLSLPNLGRELTNVMLCHSSRVWVSISLIPINASSPGSPGSTQATGDPEYEKKSKRLWMVSILGDPNYNSIPNLNPHYIWQAPTNFTAGPSINHPTLPPYNPPSGYNNGYSWILDLLPFEKFHRVDSHAEFEVCWCLSCSQAWLGHDWLKCVKTLKVAKTAIWDSMSSQRLCDEGYRE